MAKQQHIGRLWWQRILRGTLVAIGALLLIGIVAAIIRFAILQQRSEPAYQSAATLADADGTFVDINGMEIYYRAQGPVDGPAVILVHGFLLETATFEPLLTALAAQGYRTIAFDRPPFGLSSKAADLDYTRAAHGDLLVGLMDHLGIERAALLGHSAGGVVTASVALRYPDRVAQLIIVDGAFLEFLNEPSASGEERTANPAGGPMMSLIAQGVNPIQPWATHELRAFFTEPRVTAFGRANYADPTLVPDKRIAKLSRFLQIRGWEAGFQRFGRQLLSEMPINVADLAPLSMPTLILWGDADIFIPLVTGQRIAEAVPQAQLIVYPGCGHIPWEGCESSFVADLVGFLQTAGGN